MAIVDQTVQLDASTLKQVQEELKKEGLGAWLLYNFHGSNPVASTLLGLPPMTRRYFVLIPAEGRPTALTHRIEQQPWNGWIGEKRVYLNWRELESELRDMLGGHQRVAMEISEGDAVPYVDKTPAGVLEMVRTTGTEVITSADLVSAFYSRWSAEGEASHRRAAAVLRDAAHAAFARIGEQLRAGGSPNEWEIREWIANRLHGAGLAIGGDAIVGVNGNAANPHYAPSKEENSPIRRGDLVLIDLWGKETEDSIYADQTWMAFVGSDIPQRVRTIWEAVRDARDAAIALVTTRWQAGEPVAGFEVDDAARAVIRERGYGDQFIHRTGHSIDRELHGSGPNIDNLETRDTRRLITGIGFSIEPGIYLPGDIGFRSEVDVFMAHHGPEVTTPTPQRDLVVIEV
jgi:Xaa-Pro aminopeptidase